MAITKKAQRTRRIMELQRAENSILNRVCFEVGLPAPGSEERIARAKEELAAIRAERATLLEQSATH